MLPLRADGLNRENRENRVDAGEPGNPTLEQAARRTLKLLEA
jgi:hypothetical protein